MTERPFPEIHMLRLFRPHLLPEPFQLWLGCNSCQLLIGSAGRFVNLQTEFDDLLHDIFIHIISLWLFAARTCSSSSHENLRLPRSAYYELIFILSSKRRAWQCANILQYKQNWRCNRGLVHLPQGENGLYTK